ncbi:RagB/SusD family nutrient uptake outer membrane protein [Chitinophaga nivalis]|uniref:RagB/SusD family nutrient uptake outer membrane protein n=1 Tax=Chitinophaga nivalis TaxID=2991709 RepID=A0ABT3IGF1_9BACT|nr:RagB/SusD family nutrient uptake outer membrane protein [Chitinophaga nivalis]MCW3467290.1 RagB/SusD family nutrient uptake outer membrane protein [Chitinophaga nivalis]MCW3483018.1 RagB/SusD family nutrient uptake outer membrane protein [Chitinophaga nivalis]
MLKLSSYYLLGCLLIFTGCRKFLEKNPQDEFVPATVNDLRKILAQEGYPAANRSLHPYVCLLDDDIKCVGEDMDAGKWKQGKSAFTWSKTMYSEMQLSGDSDTDSYAKYYQRIKGCNVVLDNIPLVQGSTADKNQLTAEAQVLRAYYYLMLVNLYGRPYNDRQCSPDQSPGVPLVLSGKVADACLHRNTVAEVYAQITRDITNGCALLEACSNTAGIFCIGRQAAWLLAGRIFLYMENWDQVIRYNNKLLAERSQLENMRYWAIKRSPVDSQQCFLNPGNKEVLFLFGSVKEYNLLEINQMGRAPYYYATDELTALYEKGDLRADVYLNIWKITGAFSKVNSQAHMGKSFRLSEAYLNRAEAASRAYALNGNRALLDQAIHDLNTLRQARFNTTYYEPLTAAGFLHQPKKILQYCLEERRRELCFEEHRWFDLRRYGMPAITHFYYQEKNRQPLAYHLSEKNPRYVLPIPDMALARNPSLEQNP